jgi:hypothetical protein
MRQFPQPPANRARGNTGRPRQRGDPAISDRARLASSKTPAASLVQARRNAGITIVDGFDIDYADTLQKRPVAGESPLLPYAATRFG